MSLDRTERAGLGIAAAGHVLLFAILSAGYLAVRPPLPIERESLEVQLVDEVGLESGAPQISTEAPAPKLAEVEAPVEPVPPEPAPPEPAPVAKAVPQPKAVAATKPSPKAAPPKQKPARQGGRLAGILEGISDRDSTSRSKTPPARTITAAAQASLAAAVRRQIKPHWVGPNGPDVEQLKTVLEIDLARDGTVRKVAWIGTEGVNASNRSLAELHRERAIKAVRLASPFELPAEFYGGWKSMRVSFDWRLSQ